MMSEECVTQVAEALKVIEIDAASVDQVLAWSILLITSKLITIYAFDAFSRGSVPTKDMVDAYLTGSSQRTPLDFYNFPRVIRDISVIKKKAIGSPMYGPSGMMRGVLAMAAQSSNDSLVSLPRVTEHPPRLEEVLLAAYNGEEPQKLLKMTEEVHSSL